MNGKIHLEMYANNMKANTSFRRKKHSICDYSLFLNECLKQIKYQIFPYVRTYFWDTMAKNVFIWYGLQFFQRKCKKNFEFSVSFLLSHFQSNEYNV